MPTLILASVNPDNTPHGYNLTFAFPMLLFIVIGGILYLLFSRPHRRIPTRSLTLPARSAGASGGRAAAPGGTAESRPEPHGAHLVASAGTQETDQGQAADQREPAGTGEAESEKDSE